MTDVADDTLESDDSIDSAPTVEEALYLIDSVSIDREDITEEYVRLPTDMGYWNEKYAQAHKAWIDAKIFRDQIKVTLYIAVQSNLRMTAKGRVTIAEIDAEVAADPEYLQTLTVVAETEGVKLSLHGTCKAIDAKKDMLISLGAHLRAEMGDLSIREYPR